MAHYVHSSVSSATQVAKAIADILSIKVSRMRENHAHALDYKSYNALCAQIKERPVALDPEIYFEAIGHILFEKHNIQLSGEHYEAISTAFDEHMVAHTERNMHLVEVDFQIIAEPSADPIRPPSFSPNSSRGAHPDLTLFEYLNTAGGLDINEDMDVRCYSFEGDFDVEQQLDGCLDDIIAGKCVFLRAVVDVRGHNGHEYSSGWCRAVFLSSKPCNLDVDLDTPYYFDTNSEDSEYGIIQLIDVVSNEIDWHDSNTAKMPRDVIAYESAFHSIPNAVQTIDELIRQERNVYFTHCDRNASSTFELGLIDAHSIDVNHDTKRITISCPRFMALIDSGCTIELAQKITNTTVAIKSAFESLIKFNKRYHDYSIHLATVGRYETSAELDNGLVLTPIGLLEVLAPSFFKSEASGLNQQRLDAQAHLRSLTTPDLFIGHLKSIGVTGVSINNLIEHDAGDMICNVFACYAEGEEYVASFEVMSLDGYCKEYSELIARMAEALPDGAVIHRELEYNWQGHYVESGLRDGHSEDTLVLELPPAPSLHTVPHLVLAIVPEQCDYNEVVKVKAVDQGLVPQLLPTGHFNPPASYHLTAPVMMAIGDPSVPHLKMQAKLSHLSDPLRINHFEAALKSLSYENLNQDKGDFLAMILLWDQTESEVVELLMRSGVPSGGAIWTVSGELKAELERQTGIKAINAVHLFADVNFKNL